MGYILSNLQWRIELVNVMLMLTDEEETIFGLTNIV